MKRCMYCGNENDDSSQTCSKCGNPLLDTPPQQAVPGQSEDNRGMAAGYPGENVLFPQNGEPHISTEEKSMATEAAEKRMPAENPQETLQQTEPAEENRQVAQMNDEDAYYPASQEEDYFDEEDPEAGFYGENAQYQAQNAPYPENGDPYSARSLNPYSGSEGYYPGPQAYGQEGYEYGRPVQNVQQQYAGQAYGYPGEVQQYGAYGYRQPMGGYEGQERSNPALSGAAGQIQRKSRRMIKSFGFFLVVLLYTLSTASSIYNTLAGNMLSGLNAIQNAAQNILGNNLAITFMNGVIDIVEGLNTPVLIAAEAVLFAPVIFTVIGMWMMFFQTKRSAEPISTSGYTLVKSMVILKFIFYCIVLTVGLIISVAFVVAAGASSSIASIIVGIVLLLVMIILSVLVILFYVQLLHCIKVLKWNAKTGSYPGRIAVFVPTIGILLAVATGLSMIPMAPNDYPGLISKAATTLWMLSASIWVLVYRAKVRK